ncbi:hypothetical protein WMY93_014737 [Mugilogobius chulae]|uniref:Ig-like domain-containing protein n=1 Tax=Mugilogobius chulae TaxID=88201 RepID=A0AAW0P649_9GOBI
MGVEQISVFVLLMQAHIGWGQHTMITPSQPITVSVGSDVALPCQLEPVKDLRDMVVEWARHDLTPRFVHVRRDGLDLLIDQNPLYLGRTTLSESRLQKGDMTLSLTRVKLSDGGTYQCFVPKTNTKAEVTLLVVSVAPPSVSLTKERSGSPVLRCESRGWYPKPELEWLDSEGTVLLRTEAQKEASDELFSVSSRLSVEQKHGNTFTCRVRQKESGQTRETQLILTDEFLEACSSCSVPWVLFSLGLCVIAAAAAFVVWKFKINKTKTKTVATESQHEDCEAAVPLLKPKRNVKYDSGDQKLNEYQEDMNKITAEIRSTEDLKEEGEEKNGNKIETSKEKKQEKIQKMTNQVGEYKIFIEDIDKEIGKIDKIVRKSSEKKGKLQGEEKQMKKQMEKEKKRLEETVQPEIKQVEVKDERQNDQKETDKSQIKETEAEGEKMEEKQEIPNEHCDDKNTELTDVKIDPEIPEQTRVQSEEMEKKETESTTTDEQDSNGKKEKNKTIKDVFNKLRK